MLEKVIGLKKIEVILFSFIVLVGVGIMAYKAINNDKLSRVEQLESLKMLIETQLELTSREEWGQGDIDLTFTYPSATLTGLHIAIPELRKQWWLYRQTKIKPRALFYTFKEAKTVSWDNDSGCYLEYTEASSEKNKGHYQISLITDQCDF
ncbi:hypothetical protein N9R79_10795 [Vibrio sp.]|nr:hypothetical protein [Vibrio sp.]